MEKKLRRPSNYWDPLYRASRERWGFDEALQFAAEHGKIDAVQLMLDCGADVNDRNDQALWLASANGHNTVVTCLLDNGADPHVSQGSALRIAAINGHVSTARLLLERGACVDAGWWDDKVLWSRSARGEKERAKNLLDQLLAEGVGRRRPDPSKAPAPAP